MLDMYVSLGTIESVKNFVTKITEFEEDFDLIQGKYVIDAKSVLGIFSIDLSKPVLLRINAKGDRLEQIKNAEDLGNLKFDISNKAWLNFAQQKPYKNG